MDGELGGEVAPSDVRIQRKEGEHVVRPDSEEMVIPAEVSLPERGDILGKKSVDRNLGNEEVLEHARAGRHDLSNTGGLVEELIVRNVDSSDLALVGTSRQNERRRHNQIVGGSGSGSSFGNRDNGQALPGNAGYAPFPEFIGKNPSGGDHSAAVERLISESAGVSGSMPAQGGIKTKILSKSGFSEFFVKTTLKGKGIICRGLPRDSVRTDPGVQNIIKSTGSPLVAPIASLKAVDGPAVAVSHAKSAATPSFGATGFRSGDYNDDGVSLRHWLKAECHKASKAERLHIFRQIVDLVDYPHSQGAVLHYLRPSFFKLLQSNQVKYIGNDIQKDQADIQDFSPSDNFLIRKRLTEEGTGHSFGVCAKKKTKCENSNLKRKHFRSGPGFKSGTQKETDVDMTRRQDESNHALVEYGNSNSFYPSNENMEDKWYASPEELNDGVCTISSNIYSLGVLLFELLCHFESERARASAMSELRHRIFPPNFLSENLKEAGFCLQLLHPEPSLRPLTRDILQSEVVNGFEEVMAKEIASSIEEEDGESELLLYFLATLEEQKQKQASKLVEDIGRLEADIKEIERRHNGISISESFTSLSQTSGANESKLMKNIGQLETAYFSMRSETQLPETGSTSRPDNDVLQNRDNWSSGQNSIENPDDSIGAHFDGFCKFARYSKFEVRGSLRSGEFNNSGNVICSLGFDRDEDYFAAAWITKKIKIFEFNAFFNDSVDIHYPVVEMANRARLSCICWNSYIKSYLASTDYDGVVKLWDANTGQTVSQYSEHEKRAWSVDFSRVSPTKLASGSDDGSVKLWSINERNSVETIRNAANICCVQFSAHSSHMLAFGSADYKTYCYDLRNARVPWCVLSGHEKAVSFIKFLDSETIVTASPDNSLKLWDLNKTNSTGPSTTCSSTFLGHTNEKNFIGLSVADGYIACGSETNEVFSYYKSLPMPIASHKFGSIDPISGKETEEDNGLFVSSVCWKGNSDMLVAANSNGCIKVLQMVRRANFIE